MQSEAGQSLVTIVKRKELERRAGGGVFFWGIGNAPNRSVKKLASKGDEIDVVFSQMKTRPKIRDAEPDGVVVWQSYFDMNDVERELPRHVLVTSRCDTPSGKKRVHYALMCSSEMELGIEDQGPFDHTAYRNISEAGGNVGPSQVTALVTRTHEGSVKSDYRINFRAKLTGSYWVRLGKPLALGSEVVAAYVAAFSRAAEMRRDEWIHLVSSIRQNTIPRPITQSTLF